MTEKDLHEHEEQEYITVVDEEGNESLYDFIFYFDLYYFFM